MNDAKAPASNVSNFPTTTSGAMSRQLTYLKGFGDTHLMALGISDGAWLCLVDARIPATGAIVKVRSSGKHQDPAEAVQDCYDRMQETLRLFGGVTIEQPT